MKEFDSDLNFHSFSVTVMRLVTMAQRGPFFFLSSKPADYTFFGSEIIAINYAITK